MKFKLERINELANFLYSW